MLNETKPVTTVIDEDAGSALMQFPGQAPNFIFSCDATAGFLSLATDEPILLYVTARDNLNVTKKIRFDINETEEPGYFLKYTPPLPYVAVHQINGSLLVTCLDGTGIHLVPKLSLRESGGYVLRVREEAVSERLCSLFVANATLQALRNL